MQPSLDSLSALSAEVEHLKDNLAFAKRMIGVEGRPCPLCTYEEGYFQYPCSMHGRMRLLEKENERLRAACEAAHTYCEDKIRAASLGDRPMNPGVPILRLDDQLLKGLEREEHRHDFVAGIRDEKDRRICRICGWRDPP